MALTYTSPPPDAHCETRTRQEINERSVKCKFTRFRQVQITGCIIVDIYNRHLHISWEAFLKSENLYIIFFIHSCFQHETFAVDVVVVVISYCFWSLEHILIRENHV
jgi:hypothetical protein